MTRWMPGLAALRDYKLSYLPHDLGAGLTLGAVMEPVGLAYGELAGLPLAGLYGSMLPLVAYALFGSARQLIVGLMHGLALVIVGAQLPKVLGIKAEGETTLEQFVSLLSHLGDSNLVSLAIGAGSFAVIVLCRRFAPRLPGAVLALVIAALAVVLFG